MTEPPQTEERRGEIPEKFGPLPAIAIGYTVPARHNSDDWFAASILDRALHGGRVGRVYRRLVLEKQIARRNRRRRGRHRDQRPHANGHAHFSQALNITTDETIAEFDAIIREIQEKGITPKTN